MAMTYVTGKNSYTSMRDIQHWINCLNIPNISIHLTPWTDEFVVVCSHTKQQKKISRYELEDAKDPKQIILEAISEVMAVSLEKLGEIIKEAQNRMYGGIGGAGQYQIPSGAGGGGGGGFAWSDGMYDYRADGTVITTSDRTGAIGAPFISAFPPPKYSPPNPFMINDKEEQLKSRLFSEAEREELRQLKQKVRNYFTKYRSTEEMIYIFNTSKLVIAGGCFASILNGENVNDYDVFLLDDEGNRRIAQMIVDKFDTTDFSVEDINDRKVKIGNRDYMNNEEIEQTIFFTESRMQYITTKYKTREDLVQHFDFKHCCVSYDLHNDRLFITRQVYDLIKSKTLLPNNISKTPAQWRYEKFLGRGWTKPEIMFL
jgi:hypothetical protein